MTGSFKEELFMVLWIIILLLSKLNGYDLFAYLASAMAIWSAINLFRAAYYEFKALKNEYENKINKSKD